MRHTLKLGVLALAVTMAACNDSETTSTSTTTTDSTAAMQAPMPATPETTPAAPATTGMTDQEFVTKASAGNVAEVAAHKAASTHAMSADVKMHAGHMLTDHKKLGDDMKALATKKGLTVSAEPPTEKQQMLDDMNATKKGKDWDVAYLDAQVKDHEETIALFESASSSVQDADLKALVDKTLPTLRSHLQMVKDAQAKVAQ